jgi:hypothetical protein
MGRRHQSRFLSFSDNRSCRIIDLKRQIALLQKYQKSLEPVHNTLQPCVRRELDDTLKKIAELSEALSRVEAEP